MVDDFDIYEDLAALVEYNLDVEGEQLYWELDIESNFKDSN